MPDDPSVEDARAEGLDRDLIARVVGRFYELAREDAVIGPVFRTHVPDAEWQAHLDKIGEFWASSMLGTRSYHGRPMPAHLAMPELEDKHFRRWLALFRHVTGELCGPATATLFMNRAERMANSFRMNIAAHRGDLRFPQPLEPEHYP